MEIEDLRLSWSPHTAAAQEGSIFQHRRLEIVRRKP